MDLGVIAVRYARALIKNATANKIEDQVYREASTLAEAYIKVPQLRTTIDNPMLQKEAKQRLIEAACGAELSNLMKRFVALVLKEGRESILQFIANSYITLYRKEKNIIRGKLTTAAPVSQEIEEKMRAVVQARTNGDVEFNTALDPDLIGGFILEYDTYRMDASVKAKLNAILAQLKK